MQDVRIEPLEQDDGRRTWRVRMGRKALTFDDEAAARAFAAQLHMRLIWLEQTQPDEQADPAPGEKA